VEDAVAKARELLPPIFCLDMHMPATRTEWENDPMSGYAEAGLEALSRICSESEVPDFGVVVLTDLYDRDDLRAAAVRRGIDINHWVAKDADWKTNLAFALWRLNREFKLGIRAPVDDEAETRLLIRLERSSPRKLWINGVAMKLSVNRSRLVWTLAERENIAVSKKELLRAVHREDFSNWPKDERSALISLIRNTRKYIQDKLADTGKQIDAKKVIVESGEGYMLRGLVNIQD